MSGLHKIFDVKLHIKYHMWLYHLSGAPLAFIQALVFLNAMVRTSWSAWCGWKRSI